MSFNFFQLYFNFASGHLCYGLGNHNTRLTLSNNFLLIIPLTVWRKGPKHELKHHMKILFKSYVANWYFSFSTKIIGGKQQLRVKMQWTRHQGNWALIRLCYLLSSCVTWGSWLHLSGFLFPNWKMRRLDYLIITVPLVPESLTQYDAGWPLQCQHFGFGPNLS